MADPARTGAPSLADSASSRRRPTQPPFRRPAAERSLLRFFSLTLRQGHEDSILLTASALAFVTILSLVPFLAALSFIGSRVFDQSPDRSLEIFVQVLPYSEHTVTDKLREFLGQAEGIHGFGLAALFATSLLAFATVEESINRIWDVSRRRPLRFRLLSFFLLLFLAPVLIGASLESLILLRQSPALRQVIRQSVLLHVAPFLITVVGLTLLYWVVPYTKVKLSAALAGGMLAGILLELLRQGYGYYVELFRGVSTVYGSSAFAFLFMISIELTWAIILLGSEAAFTAQHFALLTRGMHKHPPVQASWVGLSAVALLAERYQRGEPALAQEALAAQLTLTPRDLERTLHPLLQHGLVGERKGHAVYLIADPRRLSVDQVFDAFEHRARRGVEHAGAALRPRLERLILAVATSRSECLGPLTVSELLVSEPTAKVAAVADEPESDSPPLSQSPD